MVSNPNTKPKLILPNGWIILWSKTQKQWWFYHQTLGKCWDLGSLVERCLNDVVDEGHQKSITPPVSGKRGNNASASLGSDGGTVSTNKSIIEEGSNTLAVSSSNEEPQGLKSQDEAKTTSFNTEKRESAAAVQQQQQNEEEMQKQIYIEKYGLLPSITPLSKRYGRMKRQQQQHQQEQKGDEQQNLPSTEEDKTASANNDNTTKSAVDPTNTRKKNTGVAKRKRRGDLLGAASRIRRSRLNNNTTATTASFHTTTLRNPKRRREVEEEEKADDWVWKAMNRTDEKENRDNDDGDNEGAYSVKKRGKFTNSSSSTTTESSNVDTPPHKHSPKTATTLPPISLTSPKTPGPSKATFGSATPAPKKFGHDTADTNTLDDGEKPSIPFSFGKDDDSAAKKETTQQPAATATPGTSGYGSSAPA